MIHPRVAIAAITLSASALVGIAQWEDYVEVARPPVAGDVPTNGWGATHGVKLGDKTTPTRALVRLLDDANSHSQGIKRCISAPLYQHEFDAYSSLAFNIGVNAFCGSTLVVKLNSGDYRGGCEQIKRWDRFKGKPLRGLTKRRQSEYQTCIGGVS